VTADREPLPSQGFEVVFSGRWVELLIPPAASREQAPGLEAVVAALRSSPLRLVDGGHVARELSRYAHSHPDPATEARIRIGQVAAPAYSGSPCAIVVSLDRLAAYAIPIDPPPPAPPAPPEPAAATEETAGVPEDAGSTGASAAPAAGASPPVEASAAPPPETPGGAVADALPPPLLVTATELRGLAQAEGVVAGLLDDVIDAFGDGTPLPDLCCIARGTLPQAGEDATLEYHIESDAPATPMHVGHGSVDFHALSVQRFVTVDVPLATKHPAVEGTPGCDVLGSVLEPPRARNIDLARLAGTNTRVEGDVLLATIVGRPVLSPRGAVEVLPIFEVPGDVNYAVGNIEFPGDVIVRGDVKSGFSIVAGGSVNVRGLVEGASITAGTDLSVLGTVGERESVFEVGGELSARYLHTTEAHVAGAVNVIGEIVNCRITADSVRTGSQGRIVGGSIEVRTGVDTGIMGSREGTVTEVHVTSDEPEATIRVMRTVQPGLVVQIGTACRRIQDQVDGASFWNVNGQIIGLRSTADLKSVEELRTPSPAPAAEVPGTEGDARPETSSAA